MVRRRFTIVLAVFLVAAGCSSSGDAVSTAPGPTGSVVISAPSTTSVVDAVETSLVPASDATDVAPAVDPELVVSSGGMGSVRIGMTVAEAREVSGDSLKITDFESLDGFCYWAQSELIDGVQFQVFNDGADAVPAEGFIDTVYVTNPEVVTPSGLHVGSTEAEVLATFPDRIKVQPNEYDPTSFYFDYVPDDPDGNSVRFNTDGDKVVGIQAGRGYRLVEGCL